MVIPVSIQLYYKCLKHTVHALPQVIWSSNQAEQWSKSLYCRNVTHEPTSCTEPNLNQNLSLSKWKLSLTRSGGTNHNHGRTLAHTHIWVYKMSLPQCLHEDKSWETSSFSASQKTSFSFSSLLCLYESPPVPITNTRPLSSYSHSFS
jgi:hypothetical protein